MRFAELLLFLSVVSNITAYVIYIYSIFKNKIKPHAFTFLAWALVLGLNFIVQIISDVGESSILLGTNFFFCLVVFCYCLKKGYTKYDKTDWICLASAVSAIAMWWITKTPIYSILLSCLIDFFSFLPSFRKSFKKPHEDSALTFFISGFEYLLSFPSYNVFSFSVLLYPIFVLSIDFTYAGMMVARRLQLKKNIAKIIRQ